MKKLFVIILALFVGFAYGANENVPTSKKFVDDALAQKQPKFDGLGNDKLMLYSATTDGVVASRDIVTTLGTSTSADSVPTVGAINTGLNTKQDILNGDAGWVAENTGIAGAVAQKPIYSATNNYSNALVEVETLNNAVINAVNSELTVVPGVGWTINTAANLNLLPTPQTYNDVPPGGYTQLEYLESTGTQYIDTGINYTGNHFVVNWKAVDFPMSESTLFAAHHHKPYSGGFYYKGENERTYYIGKTPNIDLGYKDVFYEIHSWQIIVNGQTVSLSKDGGTPTSATFDGTVNTTDNICLFNGGFDWNGNMTQYAKWQLYNWSLLDNNQLVRNFIPARRNNDGELGLYDTVSGTFFTNAGTGEFIAGPVVTNP